MNKLLEIYPIQFGFVNNRLTCLFSDSKYEILAEYLDFWRHPDSIRDTLLPKVDAVLNRECNFEDIGADAIGVALVELNETQLSNSDLGFKPLLLPTIDFRNLIIEWLNFIEKPYVESMS